MLIQLGGGVIVERERIYEYKVVQGEGDGMALFPGLKGHGQRHPRGNEHAQLPNLEF